MSVGNPEQFKFKILTTGREDVDNRKPCDLTPLTLEKLLKWIDVQRIDENTKSELKKSASKYPHQALGAWRKNYAKHVAAAQAKVKTAKPVKAPKPKLPELGDEPMEYRNERDLCKDFCKDKSEAEECKSIEFHDDFDTDILDEFENSGGDQS